MKEKRLVLHLEGFCYGYRLPTGAPDCVDQCPADPNKTAVGFCGCGTADSDADEDGEAWLAAFRASGWLPVCLGLPVQVSPSGSSGVPGACQGPLCLRRLNAAGRLDEQASRPRVWKPLGFLGGLEMPLGDPCEFHLLQPPGGRSPLS
eukprot:11712738-Alexandrium_andersonii.AAC.1